ncbi:uncharacterized protein LOC120332930 [Styela clava]
MNESSDIVSKLTSLNGEVHQLRETISKVETIITQQSNQVNEIYKLLLAFGDGLQPILHQAHHASSSEQVKEQSKPIVENDCTRPRQRKLSQADLLAETSSQHVLQSCEITEKNFSQVRLTASRSSPAFNTNLYSSNFLNVNTDESQNSGLKRRNRTASFSQPREKNEEVSRIRSTSFSVTSAKKSGSKSESLSKISRSSSLKKLSCESGIGIHDELFIDADDEIECCDIVVPVPNSNIQECISDKDGAICNIHADTMAETVNVSPTTYEKGLENECVQSQQNNNNVALSLTKEQTAHNSVQQHDANESLLAARIRKISKDKHRPMECIPGTDDVTRAIDSCDKNHGPSTTFLNEQQDKTMSDTKCSSAELTVQIKDFDLTEKSTVLENTQQESISDTSNIEASKHSSASVTNQYKDAKDDSPSFALLKERVYSCSDLNQASSTRSSLLDNKMKLTRQHSVSSNASSDSAPAGLYIKLGHSESEGEEIEHEIKINPMPRPAFIHRVVQVKCTNSKYFYDLKEQVGGGRFGRVYKCVEKKTGLSLAAKCFKCKKPHETTGFKSRSMKRPINIATKRTDQEPVDKEDVRHEISIMNSIDHENIIKIYDAFEYENTMTLIMEYMDGGEMFERVLVDRSHLTELDAILYMRQICKAMQYLHKNLILHLDLKPENILCLDRDSHHIKIIDFGLSRKYNPRQKLMVHWGTPEFMAPEVLNYELVSAASDMWSVGVICYILVSGVSPFLGNDDKETIQNIIDSEWEFDEEDFEVVSADARDFISRLLVDEKRGRMSAAQCLRHDWLSKPLTTNNHSCLQSKKQLKKFMARMHWKAGVAAVSAANWLFSKNSPDHSPDSTPSSGTSV